MNDECTNCGCPLPRPMVCPLCRRGQSPRMTRPDGRSLADTIAALSATLVNVEAELGRALRRLAEVERLLGQR